MFLSFFVYVFFICTDKMQYQLKRKPQRKINKHFLDIPTPWQDKKLKKENDSVIENKFFFSRIKKNTIIQFVNSNTFL